MVKKTEKNKILSITQIIILIVGIVAFSYFVGSEFRVVSAQTKEEISSTTSQESPEPENRLGGLGFGGYYLPRSRITPLKAPPPGSPVVPPKVPTILKANEGKLVTGILGNAAIAASIYAGSRFILGQIGASPEFTK